MEEESLSLKVKVNIFKKLIPVVQNIVSLGENNLRTYFLFNNIQYIRERLDEVTTELNKNLMGIENDLKNILNMKKSSQEGVTDEIDKSINTMKILYNNLIEVENYIDSVKKNSDNMTPLLSIMEEIAIQIKLLSINASIEAHRAGKTGVGFIAVSNGIKKLSEKTTNEIDSIQKLRDIVKEDIDNISNILKKNKKPMEASEKIFTKTFNTINQLQRFIRNNLDLFSLMNEKSIEITQKNGEIIDFLIKSSDATKSSFLIMSYFFDTYLNTGHDIEIVLLAIRDHLSWKFKFVKMLMGSKTDLLERKELTDSSSCRLGKWYNSIALKKYYSYEEIPKIKEPHDIVHKEGARCYESFIDNRIEEAMEAFEKMDQASIKLQAILISFLEELEKAI